MDTRHLFRASVLTLTLFAACDDDGGNSTTTTNTSDTADSGACATSFDCSAATPYCRVTAGVGACLAALDECSGDDAGETDDGPSAASDVTIGSDVTAKTCTGSGLERDWYRFTLAATDTVEVRVSWSDVDAHFNPNLYDANGVNVDTLDGGSEATAAWDTFADLPAGEYFVEIDPNTVGIGEGDSAVAYTLAVTTP